MAKSEAPESTEGGGSDRTANLLGALALVVTDRMVDAMAAASGQSVSPAAALSALFHFLDGPTIDLLRQVLGLTSSGTVRLVDNLERAGFVSREPGPDGRSTAVMLTDRGRGAAEAVSSARAQVLSGALADLSPKERTRLDELLAKVLVGMIRGPGATRWLCRLCDIQACGRPRGQCPVATAVEQRYSSPRDKSQESP